MANTKISALTALTGAGTDAAADLIPIVDTSATTTKNITPAQLLIGQGVSGTNTGDETEARIGVLINGSIAATPNDTDLVATSESSLLKKITWTNVKAFLKTYFDTLYQSNGLAALKANNLSDLASASTARTNLGLGTLATQSGTYSGTSSGTNTGDQTTIVGITGTKAQFDTACTDGNFMYIGDAPISHTHPQSDITNLTTDLGNKQPLDSDLTTIAGLTATTDNFIQSKSSAWASRTPAQVASDLQSTGLVANMVGFRTIPQNAKSVAYTTVAADSGKHILHPSADTTARTFTINSNANVAYPIGTAITFINQNSGGVVTIAITTDTMRLAGAGTTGSRTLAANGVATAIKIDTTEWIISGTGLT